MSIGYASKRLGSDRTLSAAAAATQSVYERPSEWLNLPTLEPTDNKLVGLIAVNNNATNFVALTCSAVGGYTVDWGDGSAPVSVASGVQTNYNYNFDTVPGDAISRGYKQCIVTVTPTNPAAAFTILNLNVRNPSIARTYNVPWLDIAVSGPSLTALPFPGLSPTITMSLLESVTVYSGTYNGTFAFSNQNNLASVRLIGTTVITTSSSFMFQNCSKLITVGPLRFSTTTPVTDMANMFATCSLLANAPAIINTGSVTTTANMFSGCRALNTVPKYLFPSLINASNMFLNCNALTEIPAINFASVTNAANMFDGCIKLVKVPAMNFSAATSLSATFRNCSSLSSVNLTTSSALTNVSNMFTNCNGLVTVNAFNVVGVTNAASMFSNCFAIAVIPAFNFAAVTDLTSAFNTCRSLVLIGATFNAAGTVIMTTTFNATASLARMPYATFGNTFSITNCNLSATELNEVYTALPTVTGKTITVTGNWGTATDTPSIATAKGWTVTG